MSGNEKNTPFLGSVPNQEFIFAKTGLYKNFRIRPETVEFFADRAAMYCAEYVRRANADGVVLGLSGGLDSAVIGALCARSGVNVHAVLLPYGDSMRAFGSEMRALCMVDKFRWACTIFNIEPSCSNLEPQSKEAVFHGKNARLARMNLQARIRTAKLRDIAQRENRLLIGTDNLTELMLGYFTKGGNDSDFRPGELMLKREFYLLAPVIGVIQSIIDAVPSAELEPGQTDEGELGFLYKEAEDLIEFGTCGDLIIDEKILKQIDSTQHKRTPPVPYSG